jgi:hypothetical protein
VNNHKEIYLYICKYLPEFIFSEKIVFQSLLNVFYEIYTLEVYQLERSYIQVEKISIDFGQVFVFDQNLHIFSYQIFL